MVDAGPRRTARRCEQVVLIGDAELGRRCWTPAPTSTAAQLAATRGGAAACDDPINIQYTSGTTGFPKGATLSATTTS